MTLQDARKTTIIDELQGHLMTNAQAAGLLDLSVRQVQRLKREAASHGVESILHGNRGRRPANAMDPALVGRIVAICRDELAGYNHSHAADVLAEEMGIPVSVRSLTRYLRAAGVPSPKARRRVKRHRARKARKREGELVQLDASKFDWLGDGSYLHLHGAVDDATGRLLAAFLSKEETFESYVELILRMNRDGHLPREVYTDQRSIFDGRSANHGRPSLSDDLAGATESVPQFARALRESGIHLIIAGSPQAKGRVERVWGTLQDRLPKDLHRLGICTLEDANAFLRSYTACYNRRWDRPAEAPEKAYLPRIREQRLLLSFSVHWNRCLDQGLAFTFFGTRFSLPSCHGAAPHDIVTVAASPRFGLKVLCNGSALDPVPLRESPKPLPTAAPRTVRTPVPIPRTSYAPPPDHPWRTKSRKLLAQLQGGDGIPAELTPVGGDIIAVL